MKNILVPTDFSGYANNALEYAIQLAKKDDSELLLLHACQMPYVPLEAGISATAEQIDAIMIAAEIEMHKLVAKVTAKKVRCSSLIVQGIPADMILSTVVKKRINLVVMGTKGARGLKKALMGSTTARVVQNSKCPVLAIPQNASFKKIRNIVYASDMLVSDATTLKKLVGLSDTFHGTVNLVHVSRVKENEKAMKENLKRFAENLADKAEYPKVKHELLYGKNVETRLDEYVVETKPDMVVMSTHYRNLLERLFERSVPKNIAFHAAAPLMVFHRKQK